jgi:hypothetical protein
MAANNRRKRGLTVNLTGLGYFEPVVATSSVFDMKWRQGRLGSEIARGSPSGLPDAPQPAAPLSEIAEMSDAFAGLALEFSIIFCGLFVTAFSSLVLLWLNGFIGF